MSAEDRTNGRLRFAVASVQGNAVLGCHFLAQITIALQVDEKIDGMSADAEDHLVDLSFDRIEGITGAGRLLDFGFEGLSEPIDLLTKLLGRRVGGEIGVANGI